MKNFKKFLTLVLAVMMVVSSFAFSTSAATTPFEDVDADNEALVEAVDLLAYMGIAKGKSDTNFGADELVTREQFALFMYRLMKGGKDAPAGASNTTKFTDLEDSTYFYAISWANATGIVNGKSATTFGPKDPIKLQEAYAMIVRALDWEKENDLVYPFGHIEIAEQKGVELDENLRSSVGYADVLTRGDMAILLYNAFFAQTGIEETVTWVEHDDVNDTFYFVENTINPILCVKKFDAIEMDYRAIATPNFRIEGEDATYDLGYDAIYFEDVNLGRRVHAENEVFAPAYTYLTAEQVRLEADELNNYFLGEFKMYVTVKYDDRNDEYEIDKVLYADCDLNKKTVSDLTFGEVSTNKAESYYIDYVATGAAYGSSVTLEDVLDENVAADFRENEPAKLLSGKVTADGEDMYVFNAPYSYAKPSYNGFLTAYGKYRERNEKNLKSIDFYLDRNAQDEGYKVVVASINPIVDAPEATIVDDTPWDVADKNFTLQAEQLVDEFEIAYYGGLHEADLFDVNGDGLYDYINYVEYRFFQVDSDEEETFEDSDFSAADHDFPYIYTTDADVIGEDFADEDYVIGYYAPLMDTVKVHAVVKPTVDTLKNYRDTAGTITLGNGDKVDVTGDYKLLANMPTYTGAIALNADAEVEAQILNCQLFDRDFIGDEFEFYVYDGVLLHHGDVDNNYKFTENLIIPTDLYYEYSYDSDNDGVDDVFANTTEMNHFGNDDEIVRYPEEAFDPEAGKVWYLYAWVDGKTKYVPVVTEDVEPNVIVDTDGDGELDAIAPEYLNKLCTYSVDEDGVYTIKSLGYDVDNDDVNIYKGVNKEGLDAFDNVDDYYKKDNNGDNVIDAFDALDDTKKEDLQLYVDGDDNNADGVGDGLTGTITKVAGSRFDIPGFFRTVDLKAYTKIIIRVFDVEEQEFVYSVYDASSFKKSLDSNVVLENVSYIVSNNPNSRARENLVVLYAETTDVSFRGEVDKNSFRIVSDWTQGDDEDGLWRHYYDLYDPFSGEKVYDVPGTNAEKKANMLDEADALPIGSIIELEDGIVNDERARYNHGLVRHEDLTYIVEVDEAEGFIELVNFDAVTNAQYTNNTLTSGVECKKCIKDNAENSTAPVTDFVRHSVLLDGNGNATNFVNYDKNTAVAVITRTGKFEIINHWVDGKMAPTTIEAIADGDKSLLCYNDWATDRNDSYKKGYAPYVKAYVSTVDEILQPDELPTADFIVVIVNKDEPMALDAGEEFCGNTAH